MNKLKTFLNFVSFLKQRRKYWLLPIVIILLLIGLLFVFAQGSAIAPFIYPLF